MACGQGCCGKAATIVPGQAVTLTQDINDDCHKTDAISVVDETHDQDVDTTTSPDESLEVDDCCAAASVASTVKKGCCSATIDRDRDQNTTTMATPAKLRSVNELCAATSFASTAVNSCSTAAAPKCCEGKTLPCCDQSCLDRIALRECSGSSNTVSSCGRDKDGTPCADHRNKIRLTFAERLEALGCICRSLIALGQESCCLPPTLSPPSSIRRCSQEVLQRPRTTEKSCCREAGGVNMTACSAKKRPSSKKENRIACNTAPMSTVSDNAALCADACCAAEEKLPRTFDQVVEMPSPEMQAMDLERAGTSKDREHVILSISGMTCTGCETKLVRTLSALPRVKNLKTSLVLSRAEFDVVEAGSVAEVMKHLERTTEFKCERIVSQGSSLNLIVARGEVNDFIDQSWPSGVTEIRAVDAKTVQVSFDAKVIGARDLINHGWSNGEIQLAPLRLDPTLETGSKHVRHVGYMTLLSACLTIPVLILAWAPLPKYEIAYGSASLALATVVQFVVAGPFYPMAIKSFVFSRIIEMDLLIVLSTSTAYIFSVISFGYLVSGRPLSTGEFFETSTLLVTLIMVGRWVSALARQKAVESISIRSLQSSTAILLEGNRETEIDARLLQYGDHFKVSPETKIVTDGTVVSGSSEVDESMITGESRPVEKYTNSPVLAGSINGSGSLVVRLTRLPDENTISTIAGMVDEAKLSKPKIQDLADRVASYFVPVVIALTIITLIIWIVVGITVRRNSGKESVIQAITYAIAVLIVSCPCAIGLAVPMVIVIASGVAAERGVIFKSAESIEIAYKTSDVVLDKTGTITEGKLAVVQEWYTASDRHDNKSLLLGLIGNIKHPVSVAVANHLRDQGVLPTPVSEPKVLTGKGVEGFVSGSDILLQAGNSRWLNLYFNSEVKSMLSHGYTTFCFSVSGSVVAVFGLEDVIRPDAASTIARLLQRGISVHMISGDDRGAVGRIGAQLNIPETNIRSHCTPSDKQMYIQALLEDTRCPSRAANNNKPVVLFCGDGTNDAVALAQATIGVHMNEGGTAIAESAADIVLMRPSLSGILTVINVSQKSIRRIAFNFGWSFVYNLIAVLLAAGAFVNARIPPEFAGLGELVSVLPVIAAALLLRWSKI